MGTHKHGVSGTPGPNGFTKFLVSKDVNALQKRKKHAQKMYGRVSDLMKDRKR